MHVYVCVRILFIIFIISATISLVAILLQKKQQQLHIHLVACGPPAEDAVLTNKGKLESPPRIFFPFVSAIPEKASRLRRKEASATVHFRGREGESKGGSASGVSRAASPFMRIAHLI